MSKAKIILYNDHDNINRWTLDESNIIKTKDNKTFIMISSYNGVCDYKIIDPTNISFNEEIICLGRKVLVDYH